MATFKQVLMKAMESEGIRLSSVNMNIMEASRGSKKRLPFIKVAVSEETINNYLSAKPKEVGFMVFIDGDLLNKIAKEIDANDRSPH